MTGGASFLKATDAGPDGVTESTSWIDEFGAEVLRIWLDTYQTSRSFRKRGIVELELP